MANDNLIILDKFIKEVKQDITVGCQLPLDIPNKEIIRIINRQKEYIYKHYEDSVEEKYLMLKKEAYDSEYFRLHREVELPEYVFSVNAVNEIGRENFGTNGFAGMDKDFAIDKFIYRDLYKPGLQSENMMYYVIHESLYDMARQVFINKISYTYNRLTNKFRFLGELPKNDCILKVYVKLSDADLFQDELFFRWIVAHCKAQIGRVLGTFSYNLPGNVTINYDLIREEGKEEIEAIKEEMKSEEGTDYFMTS